MIRLLFLLIALLLAPIAGAVQPGEQLADPALEKRARAISAELRCLVCQNQSIDDSDAPLARDLRLLVRQQLQAGQSDAAVREFLVARYGEFVLLRPQFAATTLLLWLTPLAVLGIGAVVAFRHLRSPRSRPAEPLTAEEESSLSRIVAAQEERGGSEPNLSKN